MNTWTVGRLAKAAGVKVATVRFYERKGLMSAPARSPAGYRQYTEADLWRLTFIRRAQTFGFTLNEIGELLEAHATEGPLGVRRAAETKLREVLASVHELQAQQGRLRRLVGACEDGLADECLSLLTEEGEDGTDPGG